MPKVSKKDAQHQDHGPIEEWRGDVEDTVVNFVRFAIAVDTKPMLEGLPGNRCPCPHWGYVFSGRLVFTFDDRTEVLEAGDAFYVPAGHLQRVDAGTEYVQFSPAAEHRTVSEAIARNMRKLQGT
ncbi:MAG TPA: cupin domain-containing protein [Polyangia bacterium]|jgi:hypothetical protein